MKLMYGAKLQYHKENEEMVVKAIKEIGLEASADNPTAKYVTVIRNQNNEQMQNT
jgi:aspartate aminotransferase-like enzyme